MRPTSSLLRLIMLACSLYSAPLHLAFAADGNELVGVGAIQIGNAGAGVASPKDATWTLLNPASIVKLEQRIDIGLETILLERRAEPRGPLIILNLQSPEQDLLFSLANNDAGKMSDSDPIFSPSVGVVLPFRDITLGLGIFGVQGNSVDYPRARSIPGLRRFNQDRRAELQVIKMPITIAHQMQNGWAVGGSLLGVYTRLRTDSLTLNLTPTRGNFEWDESYGIGFKFGLYKNWDTWSFGMTYTTPQWTTELTKYRDLIQKNLDFPQQFQIGFAYRPGRLWEIVGDYKFINWSGIPVIGNQAIHGGLNWNDQHLLKLGVTYHASRLWTFRWGISYGKNPVPNNAVFTNVLFPAIIDTHVAFGISYHITPSLDVHLAYLHGFKKEVQEKGTGDIFSLGGKGTKFSLKQDSIAIELSYKF